jgi:hypothetical protein
MVAVADCAVKLGQPIAFRFKRRRHSIKHMGKTTSRSFRHGFSPQTLQLQRASLVIRRMLIYFQAQ